MAGEKNPGVVIEVHGVRLPIDRLAEMLSGDGGVFIVPPRVKWTDGSSPVIARVAQVSGDTITLNMAALRDQFSVTKFTIG